MVYTNLIKRKNNAMFNFKIIHIGLFGCDFNNGPLNIKLFDEFSFVGVYVNSNVLSYWESFWTIQS